MFVTRWSKNSLFLVFDSLSNLDCGQWYKFWIYQSHPMSALATQSVDSRARASFSYGHFCVHSFFWKCPTIQQNNEWTQRSDLTIKTLLPMSKHFVSPGHSLDDFGRSKIYIIDHNFFFYKLFNQSLVLS
jgi:hypothetical protein